MGLKISKKQNLIAKVIIYSLLGLLAVVLIKIMIWENWYMQSKSSSIRNPEQAAITDIANAVGNDLPTLPRNTAPRAQSAH